MNYQAKNYDHLIGLESFSENLLKNHFALYQGYVTNTNKLIEVLANLLKEEKTATPEYAELKRRFGWEFNGMRLHEYYFDNLTKDFKELQPDSKLYSKLEADFGSFAEWEKDFRATGAMRGIGWVILYYDEEADKLYNTWINEHDLGHLSGVRPILVMDVFEHAYMLDFGIKRADYINAFFKVIDWSVISNRL